LDDAQSHVEETLAEIARQDSATALAAARLRTAEVELMQCEIHAPVDGRIVRTQARPGIGASTLNVSTLFTLVPTDQYVVRVDLEESFVGKVKTGQRTQVTLEASPQMQIPAKVLRIGEIFGQRRIDPTDTQSRMDERVVEVVVSLPPQPYRIGQRAVVRFLP
jgi:HlyD family secretion protein